MSDSGAAVAMLLGLFFVGFVLGHVFSRLDPDPNNYRARGTLETLSAVSPCDGGYAVKHFDAGTFACIDTTWVEVPQGVRP